MSDDFVASVKGITKALETGLKLAKRISKSANFSSRAQALKITETTQALQKSLEGDSQAIRNVYWEAVRSCGEPFTKALAENRKSY
jgi:chaperonin GroEL (HSP60 family)